MKYAVRMISVLLVMAILAGAVVGCASGSGTSSDAQSSEKPVSGDSQSESGTSAEKSTMRTGGDQSVSKTSVSTASKTTTTIPRVSEQPDVQSKTLTVKALDMSKQKGTASRKRATSSKTRLLVDHDNPLFMFHAVSLSGKSYGESIVATYQALPADIRAFSAMYADAGTNGTDIEALIRSFEEILAVTDKANVPIFLQVENWNSEDTRVGFTVAQLSDLLKKHKSLMGFVHVELSCCQLLQKELDRMKTTIEACKANNALFVWQEMEYSHCTNTVNRALEDKELYELMSGYSHNVIIQDKHNGQGRHFSMQASAMGAWLGGVCDNWGSNVESWLWWEEGLGDYNDMGTKFRGFSELFTLKYPPALAGIDTICDMVGGATMYSTEELHLYESDGESVIFSEGFWSVIYPLYQMILNGKLPKKDEVIGNIKVAYQFTSPDDSIMQGIESKLFMDIYGGITNWYNTYRSNGASKKWVPTTGRYYIVPTLCKYVDAAAILPHAEILTNSNYKSKVGSTASTKQNYFNSRYPAQYTGNATLYTAGGVTYILNDLENQTENSVKNVQYTLGKSGMELAVSLREHTYATVQETAQGFSMDLTNLRLDTSRVCAKKENKGSFMDEYLEGGKMDSEADYRTTVITLTGLKKMPTVTVSGNNHATATLDYSVSGGMAAITLVSNGAVRLTVAK